MVRKVIGKHNLHVKVDEQRFRTLQAYCHGGVERISASAILETFLEIYIRDFLTPRMGRGEIATHSALRKDLPAATALVARKIEPEAFDE